MKPLVMLNFALFLILGLASIASASPTRLNMLIEIDDKTYGHREVEIDGSVGKILDSDFSDSIESNKFREIVDLAKIRHEELVEINSYDPKLGSVLWGTQVARIAVNMPPILRLESKDSGLEVAYILIRCLVLVPAGDFLTGGMSAYRLELAEVSEITLFDHARAEEVLASHPLQVGLDLTPKTTPLQAILLSSSNPRGSYVALENDIQLLRVHGESLKIYKVDFGLLRFSRPGNESHWDFRLSEQAKLRLAQRNFAARVQRDETDDQEQIINKAIEAAASLDSKDPSLDPARFLSMLKNVTLSPRTLVSFRNPRVGLNLPLIGPMYRSICRIMAGVNETPQDLWLEKK